MISMFQTLGLGRFCQIFFKPMDIIIPIDEVNGIFELVTCDESSAKPESEASMTGGATSKASRLMNNYGFVAYGDCIFVLLYYSDFK